MLITFNNITVFYCVFHQTNEAFESIGDFKPQAFKWYCKYVKYG